MEIFLPFTEIHPTTAWAMRDTPHERIYLEHDFAYSWYFAARWTEGRGFLQVEHDVAPWPGALDLLALCSHSFCTYRYNLFDDHSGSCVPPIGCAKFSNALISRTPRLWAAPPQHWQNVDEHLYRGALAVGIRPHIHFPPVLHLESSTLALDGEERPDTLVRPDALLGER